MRLIRALGAFVAAVAVSTPMLASDGDEILGFAPGRLQAQRDLEARFDGGLKADDLKEWMRRLTARPHHVGSAYDKQNADFIAQQFKAWGFETQIEEFQILFPTPKVRVLEMTAPTAFQALLSEPPVPGDATSGQASEQLPVYNAYSIDGDVSGPVVYVNYGVPRDYEELERRGIDVKGAIVIARYGGSWRGIKPKVAAEHGAVGCLIYSDPRDDGYFEGDVYPKGAYRPDRGAQRGSVQDMPIRAGDPLTPGVGATRDAKRLDIKDADTLTKIPVLPISYGDALPLLKAMTGPVAPEGWRGALPITYHMGPGATRAHLKLAFDWKLVPAYDVIARLPGAERPDEWIVRGNHHDGWVNGAADPISGLVAELGEARALGELHKSGWSPRRTIVYAAWDCEEEGLIGSTEWVEQHAGELTKHAAVYINTDGNGRGFLEMGGSHTLERFMNQVARDVVDPERGISVAARRRANDLVNGSADQRKELKDRSDIRLSALGSGSDFTPFLQHLGIAALNLGYTGEDGSGVYHSIYDSFDHYTRFGDPTFAYGVTLAKTVGHAVLRLADADVLPFEFGGFADTMERYGKEVATLADTMRDETAERNRFIDEKLFVAAADPKEPFVAPTPRPPVPFVSFAPLQNAVAHVRAAATAYGKAWDARRSAGPLDADKQKALDAVLVGTERALLNAAGLPHRPWFKHAIYAPGLYTGYSVKTLPAVREAIEQREFGSLDEQVKMTAAALDAFAAQVERATAIVAP